MNSKKAKSLRRAAKAIAAKFPDVHGQDSYQEIVRTDQFGRETRQLVLSSGPKFIIRRLKAALRRDPSVAETEGFFLPNPNLGSRKIEKSYHMTPEQARMLAYGDRAVPGYKPALGVK